jgi:hypothetical protein
MSDGRLEIGPGGGMSDADPVADVDRTAAELLQEARTRATARKSPGMARGLRRRVINRLCAIRVTALFATSINDARRVGSAGDVACPDGWCAQQRQTSMTTPTTTAAT